MKKSKTIKPVAKTGTKPTLKPVPALKKARTAVKSSPQIAILKPASKPVDPSASSSNEALRQEITALRTQLSRHMAPVSTGSMEEVDAMRRVLNDLMEARMNDVIRELVTIRNSAASAGGEARRIVEQMDALLSDLGAMKFEAERLEHVDPLIHAVSREVSDASLPDGIIMETLRPGFHTSRGIVVAKALVAVNRRS